MTSKLLGDAQRISARWRRDVDLRALVQRQLAQSGLIGTPGGVDVVAIGKAADEMARAVRLILGPRVARQLIVCDHVSAGAAQDGLDVVVGEHPVPGPGSLRAGRALIDFLDERTDAVATVILLSGGASSLCASPAPPLSLEDMKGLWDAALRQGVDITTLNRLRAATSMIAGGAVLRHVATRRSVTLIMVDNVVSGARWVASGLTYDYWPDVHEFESLLERFDLAGTEVASRLRRAFEHRHDARRTSRTAHENRVCAGPDLLVASAADEARRLGFRVIEMGSEVQGDVSAVARTWSDVIERELTSGDRFCVVGAGEVTVRVRGEGIGGRCQEFAWTMAGPLARYGRDSLFYCEASDGRDFIEGVGGAWVDGFTQDRANRSATSWSEVLLEHDTSPALRELDQLIAGGHTGWNLCDLYVALVESSAPVALPGSPTV